MKTSEQDIALAARLAGEENSRQESLNEEWIALHPEEWEKLSDSWNKASLELFEPAVPQPKPLFRQKTLNRRRFLIGITSLAASLTLIAMISFFLIRENEVESYAILSETSTRAGQQKELTLPDGSTVKLNASTKIRYPESFASDKREVYLEGEAYFEVVPDQKRPLIIHGNEANVKVLGTAFNIRSMPDQGIEVAVRSGKVTLISTVGESGEALMVPMMKKGISKRAQGVWKVESATEKDFDWLEGKIIFDETPLKEVVDELNRWYGADIRIINKKVESCRISSTFYRNSLDEVMETLSLIADLEVEHRGSAILLSGKGCQ